MIRRLKESFWDPVMDADRNPLSVLHPSLRYRTMIVLAVMWSTLFCLMVGWVEWLPYWAFGHVLLVVVGALFTKQTFDNASRLSHRDRYRSEDGLSARYDDLWGA